MALCRYKWISVKKLNRLIVLSEQDLIQRYFGRSITLIPKEYSTFGWCGKADWMDISKLKTCHFTGHYFKVKEMTTKSRKEMIAWLMDEERREYGFDRMLHCINAWKKAYDSLAETSTVMREFNEEIAHKKIWTL
jgi:hypothetical protein